MEPYNVTTLSSSVNMERGVKYDRSLNVDTVRLSAHSYFEILPIHGLLVLVLGLGSVPTVSSQMQLSGFCSEYILFYSPSQDYAFCSRLTQLAFHSRVQLQVNSEVVK